MILEPHMHLGFDWGLCSPKSPKTIVLIMITGKASIKGVDGEQTIILELLLANIRSRGGYSYRLKK